MLKDADVERAIRELEEYAVLPTRMEPLVVLIHAKKIREAVERAESNA